MNPVQASNSKVLDVMWFSGVWGNDCIGIVLTQNEIGEKKFFIGQGKGVNEESDMITIADHGSRVHGKKLTEFIKSGMVQKIGEAVVG